MKTSLGTTQWSKFLRTLRWMPHYLWQRTTRRSDRVRATHLIIGLADHFEPSINPSRPGTFVDKWEQERRLEDWCRDYPQLADRWRDSEGYPFRHTYFYPAEQCDEGLIQKLIEHCQAGWGEVEIHLHHGIETPDTSENTRRRLLEFRDYLAAAGCLSQMDGAGAPRYAFVHGNWALANSNRGLYCGVDNEMQILADTGCYADFTLPSAPNRAQIAKINGLYECSLPLDQQAPHRRGLDLKVGRRPQIFPLIFQGPLMVDFSRRTRGWGLPQIENAAIAGLNPPTMDRLRLWRQAAISVQGREDWVFIKLHCHGMDPRDEEAMLGTPMRQFLQALIEIAQDEQQCRLHFVTAREMVNIALAACDGREGNAGEYRDYRLKPVDRRSIAALPLPTTDRERREGKWFQTQRADRGAPVE